jgi:hypothetical protein
VPRIHRGSVLPVTVINRFWKNSWAQTFRNAQPLSVKRNYESSETHTETQLLPADIHIVIELQMDLVLIEDAKSMKPSIVESIAVIYLRVPILRWDFQLELN